VIHPLRHQVYPVVSGLYKGGFSIIFITTFYKKGLLAFFLQFFPGTIGKKVRGTYSKDIPGKIVYSSLFWQFRRLLNRDTQKLICDFDDWAARQIRIKNWKADYFHTTQDYLPGTCRAIVEVGAKLISDQIINSSQAARDRIKTALEENGGNINGHGFSLDEGNNDWILSRAYHVLLPSNYVRSGVEDRVHSGGISILPYSVNLEMFRSCETVKNGNEIFIVAYAANIRKGGHLLLKALAALSAGETMAWPGFL